MNKIKLVTGLLAILLILMMLAVPALTATDTIEAPSVVTSENTSGESMNIPHSALVWIITGFVIIMLIYIYVSVKKQNQTKRNERLIRGKEKEITKIEKILKTMKREYENTRSVIGDTSVSDIEKAQTQGEIPAAEAEIYIKRFKVLEDKLAALFEAITSMEKEIAKLQGEIAGLSTPSPLFHSLDLRINDKVNNQAHNH